MTTSVPAIQPRVILGLQTKVKYNAQYISDEEIVYPVGGVLCIHNFNQKKQKFIKLPDKGMNVRMMATSPNKKFVALVEEAERVTVSIYDPWSCKKKKQLYFPIEKDQIVKEVTAMCFTFDSKCLVVITGDPDWWMYVYRVERGKLDSHARANFSNNTGTVVHVTCNPNDPNLLVLLGNGLYRNMGCTEGNWRQYGFNKAENYYFTCGAWISQDRVLTGTNDARIVFFENAELKMTFYANEVTSMMLKVVEEQPDLTKEVTSDIQQQSSLIDTNISGAVLEEPVEITNIIAFNKGFLFSWQRGCIHFFEKESPHKYRKKTIFKIPDHYIERGEEEISEDYEFFQNVVFNEVNSISVNIGEDRIIASCNETQIYSARLYASLDPEVMMTEWGYPLHHGALGGLAVCGWKPIFMTTGFWDRTIRIWNYETDILELMKKYTEDLYACDLHPSGLFAVVGFSDRLRYMKILIDDLVVTREYPIRTCKLVKFSNMGHFFAAANLNIIQIYSSVTYEHMFNLKGHNGHVTGLAWVHDDYKLTSCGIEGAVYEWQIATTRRICETIIKICQFSDVCVTSDGKSNYGVGSDGRIREIVNSNVYGEIVLTSNGLDKVILSNSDQMIFVSGNYGVIYSLCLPFPDQPVFNEYVIHADKCTNLKITYDDRYLISTSQSCVILWKITNAEGKQIKMDKEFSPSTEVMIERADLVEKMVTIKDLQTRMNELLTEHAYQMRQTEAAHNATIKEIHEGYCAAIDELKEKNETLDLEHNQEISNINMDINKMKASHEVFVQKLEASYNEKLIVEYDKFMLLEEKMAKMRTRYDKELEELLESKRQSEETIINNYTLQLDEKEVQIEELVEKINQMIKDHEEIKIQIEDDADREIYELKAQYEKELREEQDLNVKLRGETQACKKKLQASQKHIDDLNHSVHMHEIERNKLKTIIVGLEATIGDLRKEIQERDSTIQDKEKRIAELKHKNQELEKFKFILEFKIDELKAQIEPRDRTIREQTEQINDMVNELENLQKIIMSLELQLSELREKLRATDNEVKREIVKNRAAKASLKRIKTEIHNASGLSHDIPKLQKQVKDMYLKYNADKDFATVHAEDTEAKKEFLRQRDFLERTVKALKSQVSKSQKYTGENLRLVEQNSQLIEETNNLRRNLKLERKDNKRMTALLGINKGLTNYMECQKKLETAVATREDIRREFKDQLEANGQKLKVLTEENVRLHTKLAVEIDDEKSEVKEEKEKFF